MERYEQELEGYAGGADWRERAEPSSVDFREDPRGFGPARDLAPVRVVAAPLVKPRPEPTPAPAAAQPRPQAGAGKPGRGDPSGFGIRFQWPIFLNFGVVTVTEVEAGSAAERCGIRVGDKILSYGGHSLVNWDGNREARGIHAGDTIDVVVRRRWFAAPTTLRCTLDA